MHPSNPYGLPSHLSVDLSSQMPYDVWAAFCMRCTGASAVKVSDGHRYPEEAALAAREHSMIAHPISPEDWLTEEQQEAAIALNFSLAERRILDAAEDGEFYEDERGFYYYDVATDKPRPVARARAINLIALGYLRFAAHDPRVRHFWLSKKGAEARRLWSNALRQGVVTYAEKDSTHGVSAKQRRAYLLIADGHPAAGRPRRSAAATDVQTAPDPVAAWEDDGGPCPEVQAEQRAAPTAHEEEPGVPTTPTCLQLAERAAALAVQAADAAMHAVARSRGRDTSRLDAVMLAAHEAANDAERYARMAAEDAAAGQARTVRAFAARAVTCAVDAQRAAGVEESAAELSALLERQRTAAEQEEAERERREWDARIEAELRAETGMDAENRVRLELATLTAAEKVPALGWSVGMVRAMEVAEAGRLVRRDGFAWDGRRKVARHRVLALANAGFLAIGRGADRRITPTLMGSLALYLARLAPEHVHPDDKSAYEARMAAVGRRRGMSKEDRKRAARRLPPLDPHLVRRFVRPVTLAEQEALAAREAEAAEQVWEDEGGAVPGLLPRAVDTAAAAPSAPAAQPSHEQLALLPLETVQAPASAAGPGPLVVVPCSRSKLSHPAPAGRLYTGPLHTMARAAADALTARGGRILVLSGRRRLFGLDEVVEPYDAVMPARLTDHDIAQLRAEAARHGVADADHVVLLTPSRYTRAARHIWPHAVAALEGSSGIGVMRGRLAAISRTGRLPHPLVPAPEPGKRTPGVAHARTLSRPTTTPPSRRRRRNRSRGPDRGARRPIPNHLTRHTRLEIGNTC
ncbi:DUF6884 domain-containing protein [Streptomyces albus]|uniref:DUF6884 domain-containing protein n=1 Tax=Streptomyces albus TaxID=1888 RepID=UPI0034000D02